MQKDLGTSGISESLRANTVIPHSGTDYHGLREFVASVLERLSNFRNDLDHTETAHSDFGRYQIARLEMNL